LKKNKDQQNKIEIDKIKSQLDKKIEEIKSKLNVKHVVIDCSCVNLIDSMGLEALIQVGFETLFLNYKNLNTLFNLCVKLKDSFNEIGIDLHLSYCKCK
jgi:hypothetical protein